MTSGKVKEGDTREDLSMADGFGFDFRRRKLYRN